MRDKTTGNQMYFLNEFMHFSSMKRAQKLNTTTGGWGVCYNTVSHLCFFTTLNKEQKSPYLQLCRRLNGKMLVLGFQYSKSTPIVKKKKTMMQKKPTCQNIAFFTKY